MYRGTYKVMMDEVFIEWVLEQNIFLYIKGRGYYKTDKSESKYFTIREIYNYWKINVR